jgi:hypothetical protein
MKYTLAVLCAVGVAGLVSACGPEPATESESIVWSSLTIDGSGKTVVKRDVISRAELQLRRQAREMLRTGALKPEGVAAYVQAAGARLAATGVGFRPEPRMDWANSHWVYRWDREEIMELMPSTTPGSVDLSGLQFSDGSTLHDSAGFYSGLHSGSYCSDNGFMGCSGSTWAFPAFIYEVPPPFETRDHRFLTLHN